MHRHLKRSCVGLSRGSEATLGSPDCSLHPLGWTNITGDTKCGGKSNAAHRAANDSASGDHVNHFSDKYYTLRGEE